MGRVKALQMEIQQLLQTIAVLLQDEAAHQKRLSILPELSALSGTIKDGKKVESPLSTLPDFSPDMLPTALLTAVPADPFADLKDSPNFTIKDPQVVLGYSSMLNRIDTVYKYIRLHEHKIKSAKLLIITKMKEIESLQKEQDEVEESRKKVTNG
jgi:hypothetical protein